MNEYELHTDIKFLSENVYAPYNKTLANGWKIIKWHLVPENGFQGAIYQKDDNVAVIYAGTNQLKDFFVDDIQMGLQFIPQQQEDAHKLLLEAQHMYPKANIILGGHSLGASLAQIESAHTGIPAVTFNAYGTGDILRGEGYTNIAALNITNYGNINDIVFGLNYDKQPGKTFVTNANLNVSSPNQIEKFWTLEFPDINQHYLSYMDDLKNVIESKPAEMRAPVLLKGNVEKMYIEKFSHQWK